MAKSTWRPWWVWYPGEPGLPVTMFDTEEEALNYQANPSGFGYLGEKVVQDVLARPWETPAFTTNGRKVYPGPETKEEALDRVRTESARRRILKALGNKNEEAKLAYTQGETGLDDETFQRLVDEERRGKESRKRKKES